MLDTTARTLHGTVRLGPDARPGIRQFDCTFIRAGRVLRQDGQESHWLIPAEVLQQAAPLFSGVSSYLDHPEQFGLGWRQAPSVRDLAGVTGTAAWDAEARAVAGPIRIYDANPASAGALIGALIDQVLADRAAGRAVPSLGLSAVLYHRARLDEGSGPAATAGLTVTAEIVHVQSVDWVYSPGAGGYVRAALARLPAFRQTWNLGAPRAALGAGPPTTQEESMPEETTRCPGAAGDTPAAAGALPGAAAPASDLAALDGRLSRVSAHVDRLLQLLAGQEEGQTVQGMGVAPAERTRISVGPGSLEQVELALDALLAGTNPPRGVRPLAGIRELYHLLSGDYEMTGVYQPDRVYLANVTASTMAGLCANALNKVVINEFQQYPQWWAPAVTVVDFPTLQDARWTTLGGVGELPTVAEGAAYTELTWDDQTETDSFVKKGGYLGITIEAIDKDDTNRVRSAPRALAQAAWLTLGTSISDIFTSNSGVGPTMADTGALFNATAVTTAGGHANLRTTALSLTEWRAVKLAMMKQAEVNSGTRLGALTRPRLLWVPVDLEDTAIQILATEHDTGSANWAANPEAVGNDRETRLANARSRVIVCPLWTDANNWAAQADPRLYPSIGLGFRYGRTPEIFSVADPRAGLMFTNDIMPVKVRFFYAVGPTDWRGLHKSNVA